MGDSDWSNTEEIVRKVIRRNISDVARSTSKTKFSCLELREVYCRSGGELLERVPVEDFSRFLDALPDMILQEATRLKKLFLREIKTSFAAGVIIAEPTLEQFLASIPEQIAVFRDTIADAHILHRPTPDVSHPVSRGPRGPKPDLEDISKVAEAVAQTGEQWRSRLPDLCKRLHRLKARYPKNKSVAGFKSWRELAKNLNGPEASVRREYVLRHVKYRLLRSGPMDA